MTAEANVGVVGLAAMGASLARNLARHGNKVAVFNRHYSRTEKLITEHGQPAVFDITTAAADVASDRIHDAGTVSPQGGNNQIVL